ncbi:hypothetical protein H4582DRAFT_372314 [Lactarius indigo]|nr:hypothetical protein H4582DRAFT_372314 [Lactarius indigo]
MHHVRSPRLPPERFFSVIWLTARIMWWSCMCMGKTRWRTLGPRHCFTSIYQSPCQGCPFCSLPESGATRY